MRPHDARGVWQWVHHGCVQHAALHLGQSLLCLGDRRGGTTFCCIFNTPFDETYFSVLGGSYEDDIYFWYSSYNMNNYTTGFQFEGRVHSRSGSDYIEGSTIASRAYLDSLSGDEDGDVIFGLAGDDHLFGQGGDDELNGGDGADLIEGNGDVDTIRGEAGDDTVYGGTGIDHISGGDDIDALHGDDGGDYNCGDNQDDTINGDGYDDALWGGNGADTLFGGIGTDACDGEYLSSCESALGATRPSGCPTVAP